MSSAGNANLLTMLWSVFKAKLLLPVSNHIFIRN